MADWITCGLSAIAFLVGGGYYLLSKKVKGSVGKQVDESKLYIGVPYQNDGQYVDLAMNVKTPNGVFAKTVSSQNLKALDGQDDTLRFYDYAADPLIGLDGKTIGAWLADSGNSLKAKTIGDSLITSVDVSINASGVWLINVASKDGATPTVSHSFAYVNNVAQTTGGNA